jgi:hypothetical protein
MRVATSVYAQKGNPSTVSLAYLLLAIYFTSATISLNDPMRQVSIFLLYHDCYCACGLGNCGNVSAEEGEDESVHLLQFHCVLSGSV